MANGEQRAASSEQRVASGKVESGEWRVCEWWLSGSIKGHLRYKVGLRELLEVQLKRCKYYIL
ncbi:uncharacterized protein LOC117570635 isoform X2 [Drosophila albomicans]|uniref:Uncharacterized protein LOC117570635 isoform X2 n=1 Tax=Drosophila albomicans TaxID=7291 RepID=A0A9C6T6L5_DROAB|nr:uncharacterized protein LOC117570635 isoform X2 [Drosophila albomicans]